MSIFYYEWLKLRQKRLILMLGAIFLAISCALYFYTEWQKHHEWMESKADFKTLESQYQSLSVEEGSRQAADQLKELQFYSLLSSESVIAGIDSNWMKQIEEMKRNNASAVQRYLASEYAHNDAALNRELLLYEELNVQYTAIQDHAAYMQEIERRAAQMLSASIFQEKNSFSYRNIMRTVEDFKPLQAIKLQTGIEYGLVSATQFAPADLFVMAMLFMIAFYIFHHEREIGMLRLIRSTSRGRGTTAAAKLIAMIMLTLLLSALFYGSLLLIANGIYGFGDWNRYIQSMPSFKNSVHMLTVGEYVAFYMLLKSMAVLLMGLLIALLFTLFRRPGIVFMLLLAGVGGSYFLYAHIHPNSIANGLKYLNPVAFLDTFHLIAEYRNIHAFRYPVSKMIISCLTGAIVIIALVVAAHRAYTVQWAVPLRFSLHAFVGRIREWAFRRRVLNSLLHHEWYKLLVAGKGGVIIVLAVILSIQMMQAPARTFTLDEAMYNEYMKELEGPLNTDKIRFMEKESLRYAQLSEERRIWNEKYTSGELSEDAYNGKQIEWNVYEKKEKAFRIVEQQYMYLRSLEERTGIAPAFVNQIASDELLDHLSRDHLLALGMAALLTALFGTLFTQDYRNHTIILLRATLHGRGRLFRNKLVIAYVLAMTMLACMYVPKYIHFLQYYPTIDWSSSLQSIQKYGGLAWELTVGEYTALTVIFMAFGCLMLAHISCLLSVLVRKQSLSLLLQAAIYIVPLALSYLGFSSVNLFTFNGVFLAAHIFNSEHDAIRFGFYFGSVLLLGVGAGVMSWKLYNGPIQKKE